jgi:hypothetical protein
MFEVSFDRICDIGGVPGYSIRTWDQSTLLQSLAQGDQHLGAMDINAIICQIESITTN